MADLTTFPIPTEALDPADWPEFIGPATEWQASATHLQARPVGGSTWVDIVALSEITGPKGDLGTAPAITTATITTGNLATPLDGSIHHVALTADVDGTWTAATPEGGNAATTGYYATVIFDPPGVGEGSGAEDDGPWIAPFPVGWNQVGGLDSISLAPGDDPIVCQLASVGAGVILVSAVAAVEITA